jgi:hypothetical protein
LSTDDSNSATSLSRVRTIERIIDVTAGTDFTVFVTLTNFLLTCGIEKGGQFSIPIECLSVKKITAY